MMLPIVAVLLLLGGCATRPINPRITQAEPNTGYRYQVRQQRFKDRENLVILAFSGGGTRAAAFSYGVLEFLRRTEIVGPKGNKGRLLDEVDVMTRKVSKSSPKGLRPVRRQAVRRLRATFFEA